MINKTRVLTQIILIIITVACFNNVAFSQYNNEDTIQLNIIELEQGCKLVLDANINLTDSLSIKIIKGIRDIIPRVQSLVPLDSIAIELAISNSNVLPLFGLGGRTNMDDFGITIEYYFDPENPTGG